jgi:hypothetical protein
MTYFSVRYRPLPEGRWQAVRVYTDEEAAFALAAKLIRDFVAGEGPDRQVEVISWTEETRGRSVS